MGTAATAAVGHSPALRKLNGRPKDAVPKQGRCGGTGLALPRLTTCAWFGRRICLPKTYAKLLKRRVDRSRAIGTRLRERAVFTISCARAVSAVRLGAAASLSAMTWVATCTAVYADGMAVGGCLGGQGSINCVVRWGEAGDPYIRVVPEPANQAERSRAAERERRWENRCKPVIAQDRYGVPRYRYSAPGCEFGVIEN